VTGAPVFSLREARPEDAGRLHALHTTAVRTICAPHYAKEIIDGWLALRNAEGYRKVIERGAIFVAERAGEIVGFGEAQPGQVLAVYVDPSTARLGVGTLLLQRALEIARRNYDGPIRLESTLNAISFYERAGFRAIERSGVQRGNVVVPVVVMQQG